MLGMFFQCRAETAVCCRQELRLDKKQIWANLEEHQYSSEPGANCDSVTLAGVRTRLDAAEIIDATFVSLMEDLQRTASEDAMEFAVIDDYDPTKPEYIQQLPESEVVNLQEQLLQQQMLALEGVVAGHRRFGETSDVLKHYEQVARAMRKELDVLSNHDCLSQISTTDAESDISEGVSKCSRQNESLWDELTSPRESAFTQVSFKHALPNEPAWEDEKWDDENDESYVCRDIFV